MNYFVNKIHINKLFHLSNIDIPIENRECPHLLITGKNGSGKTVLLNAIKDFLERIKEDTNFYINQYPNWLKNAENKRDNAKTEEELAEAEVGIQNIRKSYEKMFGKVEVTFSSLASIVNKYQKGDFIISFYQAYRKYSMIEPKNPTKPVYNKKGKADQTATSQFLNFLSDLKIQEALARNERQFKDAEEINVWFIDFEVLLKEIFQDDNLKLEFNYKDYSFKICTEGKKFKFTEVSDGFAAVIDIVADLILKMQDDKSLTRAYEKEGIVLIDEIETHLHLALQKVIMPLLTNVFPNIQFIVTTHSPFVLSSMPNAVAFDLEHLRPLEDLTDYSYESLAEGYFGVRTESSYAEMQLDTLKSLLEKEELSSTEIVQVKLLISDFEKLPEVASPLLIGEFRQLVTNYSDKIKNYYD